MQDYTPYLQKAFLGVIRDILSDVAKEGLTDESYYVITFNTKKAVIPDFLRPQYPEEMTIILQHQFENLTVQHDKFCVDLAFGGVPSTVQIPYSALISFADPSAQFGFNFGQMAKDEEEEKPQATEHKGAEVIDLASRRK